MLSTWHNKTKNISKRNPLLLLVATVHSYQFLSDIIIIIQVRLFFFYVWQPAANSVMDVSTSHWGCYSCLTWVWINFVLNHNSKLKDTLNDTSWVLAFSRGTIYVPFFIIFLKSCIIKYDDELVIKI